MIKSKYLFFYFGSPSPLKPPESRILESTDLVDDGKELENLQASQVKADFGEWSATVA